MNSKDDGMKVVMFLLIWAAALILWVTFKGTDKSYLNDPYWPDEGKPDCVTSPSGDCM